MSHSPVAKLLVPPTDNAAAILPTRAPSLCVQRTNFHSTEWKTLADRSEGSPQTYTTNSMGLGAR